MTIEKIIAYIQNHYKHISTKKVYGEISFFYNPSNAFKNGAYLCTIKLKDGPNDKASNLCATGAFRLNIGIPKEEYAALFGSIPKRPAKGEIICGNYDFTQKNRLLPHPVYGWMSWVCIVAPSEEMFYEIVPYIDMAYSKAQLILSRRKPS